MGTQYIVKIRFEQAPAGLTDAVEIRWLNKSELDTYASKDGISDDSRMVVGFTQLGSDVVKINPVYAYARSIKLASSNWPIDQRQLRDTIKHTRGVFAHEITMPRACHISAIKPNQFAGRRYAAMAHSKTPPDGWRLP